jgi:hypothetical protein
MPLNHLGKNNDEILPAIAGAGPGVDGATLPQHHPASTNHIASFRVRCNGALNHRCETTHFGFYKPPKLIRALRTDK